MVLSIALQLGFQISRNRRYHCLNPRNNTTHEGKRHKNCPGKANSYIKTMHI